MNQIRSNASEELSLEFSSFRPYDRKKLLAVCKSGPEGEKLFIEAVDIYLEKWAKADWLEEYEVEQIGAWISANCPESVIAHIQSSVAGNINSDVEIRAKTYAAIQLGLRSKRALEQNRQDEVPIHAIGERPDLVLFVNQSLDEAFKGEISNRVGWNNTVHPQNSLSLFLLKETIEVPIAEILSSILAQQRSTEETLANIQSKLFRLNRQIDGTFSKSISSRNFTSAEYAVR